jgi:hypothetical protein
MVTVISEMTEDELRDAINQEVRTYNRTAIIKRMHSRYGQLLVKRQRFQLLMGVEL